MLPAALGVLVTLVGGALALVPRLPRGARAAVAGPLVLLVALAGAVGWGVYAAAIAPELALGGSLLAPFLTIARLRALGDSWSTSLALLALLALGFILLAVAAAARARLATVVAPAPGFWAATVVAGGRSRSGAVRPVVAAHDRPRAWPPRAGADAPGVESRRALAGCVVGATAFVALAACRFWRPEPRPGSGLLARYPALLAMPLALLVARLLGTAQKRRPPARGEARRRPGRGGRSGRLSQGKPGTVPQVLDFVSCGLCCGQRAVDA